VKVHVHVCAAWHALQQLNHPSVHGSLCMAHLACTLLDGTVLPQADELKNTSKILLGRCLTCKNYEP